MHKSKDKLMQYWPALLVLVVVLVILIANKEPKLLNMNIELIQKNVEHLKENQDGWGEAEKGLFKADESIRTGQNSKTILNDGNNSSIQLLENTEILLDEYSNTSFKVQQMNGVALYEAKDSGGYEIKALSHNIFFKKGKIEISVNKEAKRIHLKALKGDFQVIFNDANGSSELILSSGYQITFDPAREEAINKDKIDSSYDADSIWENWSDEAMETDSNEDEDQQEANQEEANNENQESEDIPTSTNNNSTSIVPSNNSTANINPNCKPVLSAQRDGQLKGIKLRWSQCTSDDFQNYKLLRDKNNEIPVYNNSPVIVSLNNSTHNNYFDQLVKSFETYTYRVCTLQRVNRVTCSNSVTIEY